MCAAILIRLEKIFIKLIPEVMKSLTQEEFEQFFQEYEGCNWLERFEFTNKDGFVFKQDYDDSDSLRIDLFEPFYERGSFSFLKD